MDLFQTSLKLNNSYIFEIYLKRKMKTYRGEINIVSMASVSENFECWTGDCPARGSMTAIHPQASPASRNDPTKGSTSMQWIPGLWEVSLEDNCKNNEYLKKIWIVQENWLIQRHKCGRGWRMWMCTIQGNDGLQKHRSTVHRADSLCTEQDERCGRHSIMTLPTASTA